MPRYYNGKIFLNKEEGQLFRKQLLEPSVDAATLRDVFLDEINKSLIIEETIDGVYIDSVDDLQDVVRFSCSYSVPVSPTDMNILNGQAEIVFGPNDIEIPSTEWTEVEGFYQNYEKDIETKFIDAEYPACA